MNDRDEFAKAAMQGICASSPTADWTNPRIAKEAYDMADAMIAERDKEDPAEYQKRRQGLK